MNTILASKLDSIAANETFDEAALRQAQAQERIHDDYWAMLQRYCDGTQLSTDHIMLQTLANCIRTAK